MIQKIAIAAAVILVIALFVWGTDRSVRLSREAEVHAVQSCRDRGGEAIMSYSYNSDSFYLTGCKLR